MHWEDYEQLVARIYESLGNSKGVIIEGSGRLFKKIGQSGSEHQIDVLTSHTDGLHTYYTAIECKYYKKKVTKDPIAKLDYIIEDCKLDKGIIVTTKGFTSDAIKVAKDRNIILVELYVYHGSMNNKVLNKVYTNHEISMPALYDLAPVVRPLLMEAFKPFSAEVTNIYDTCIKTKDGKTKEVSTIINIFR